VSPTPGQPKCQPATTLTIFRTRRFPHIQPARRNQPYPLKSPRKADKKASKTEEAPGVYKDDILWPGKNLETSRESLNIRNNLERTSRDIGNTSNSSQRHQRSIQRTSNLHLTYWRTSWQHLEHISNISSVLYNITATLRTSSEHAPRTQLHEENIWPTSREAPKHIPNIVRHSCRTAGELPHRSNIERTYLCIDPTTSGELVEVTKVQKSESPNP